MKIYTVTKGIELSYQKVQKSACFLFHLLLSVLIFDLKSNYNYCPPSKKFNNQTDTSIKVCNIMLRFHIYFFGNVRDNSNVASIFLHLIYFLAIFYNVLNANTMSYNLFHCIAQELQKVFFSLWHFVQVILNSRDF